MFYRVSDIVFIIIPCTISFNSKFFLGVRMCNLEPEDSVSSKSKQQITLKKFLSSKMVGDAAKMVQVFTCPSCLDRTFTDFSLYNEHANSCTRDPVFVEEKRNLQDLINDMCVDGNDCYPGKGITSSQDLLNSALPERLPLRFPKDSSDSEHNEDEVLSHSYICPICNNLSLHLTNLVELNAHMDDCLNRETIEEILASESPGISKRYISI